MQDAVLEQNTGNAIGKLLLDFAVIPKG